MTSPTRVAWFRCLLLHHDDIAEWMGKRAFLVLNLDVAHLCKMGKCEEDLLRIAVGPWHTVYRMFLPVAGTGSGCEIPNRNFKPMSSPYVIPPSGVSDYPIKPLPNRRPVDDSLRLRGHPQSPGLLPQAPSRPAGRSLVDGIFDPWESLGPGNLSKVSDALRTGTGPTIPTHGVASQSSSESGAKRKPEGPILNTGEVWGDLSSYPSISLAASLLPLFEAANWGCQQQWLSYHGPSPRSPVSQPFAGQRHVPVSHSFGCTTPIGCLSVDQSTVATAPTAAAEPAKIDPAAAQAESRASNRGRIYGNTTHWHR
ncbi:hypothetical protein S7711_10358 [Stachybotrys chartarum IBT 7711]|uniref:Uncharacterized protein n=1 Tax=Stachybotrys chartarum (strain CBS 109288 / IBT 7711) TaxID=1280523 RepID=A0A084B9G9_STACB|nr:hypothetical protein S7711_10358 [Stachybotrys chartarum IBT 7711]KFA55554.1 hypothetical protein S40293_10571 [Stachybotrys chartarum IBT 40293]